MLIHLVEPLASGHRLLFVRRIADAARSCGHRVLLSTCASSYDHPAFAQVAELVQPLAIVDGDDQVARMCRQRGLRARLGWHRLISRHWRSLPPEQKGDVVVLTYADYCLLACGLLGSPFADKPWVGIIMQPTFHHPAMGLEAPAPRAAGWSSWLFGRALRTRCLGRLLALDETLPAWADGRWPRSAGRCVHLGDPADPLQVVARVDARRRFALPPGGRVVLVFGAIDPRKGLRELVAATSQPAWPPDLIVLALGTWNAAAAAQADDPDMVAARKQGRLVVHDRWADEADEAAAFAAADLVWVGYLDFFQSSGVLMQAALAQLPVVSCRAGLIGWLTTRHQLGAVVDPRDAAAVAMAVAGAVRGPAAAAFNPPTGEEMGRRVVAACQDAPT